MPDPDGHNNVSRDAVEVDNLSADLFPEEFKELPWAREPLQRIFGKVERAKQEWESTADALPELICLVDDRGRVIRANRTVETWNLGEVVAVRDRDLHEMLHPGCTGLFCYLSRFLQRQRAPADEQPPSEIEVYDGILKRHLSIQCRPVPPHKASTRKTTVVVVSDITERKQAEDALRRHAKRLEVMNDIGEAILAACSPETVAQAALSRMRYLVPLHQARVVLWKPELGEFFVLASDTYSETDLKPGKTFPPEAFRNNADRQPDTFFAVDDLSGLSDLSYVEQQMLREGVRAYANVPMFAESEFIGLLSLGADQPDAFDREQTAIAFQLADLLAIAIRQAQLYARLDQANKELTAALAAKDQMIQSVSHEWRTPLSLLNGYTDLLENMELGPLTSGQKHAVAIMRRQQDHLLDMVTRLLALQTIDDMGLQLEPLDLGAWLRQVVGLWQARVDQAAQGVQFQLDMPGSLPPISADPDQLWQVFEDLLDNAVKFSPDGGEVRIRVQPDDHQIIVVVSDDGIGIPSDKLDQVFNRFYQVDEAATRRFRGLGIGLTLCRAVVEAHGGRIWAESPGEGQGSTFFVALPVVARVPGNVPTEMNVRQNPQSDSVNWGGRAPDVRRDE